MWQLDKINYTKWQEEEGGTQEEKGGPQESACITK